MEKKKVIKEIEEQMLKIVGICKLNDIDYLSLSYVDGNIHFNNDPENKNYFTHFLIESEVNKKLKGANNGDKTRN